MGGLLIYIGKHDSSRINTFRFNSGPLGDFSPALEKGAVLKDNRGKKRKWPENWERLEIFNSYLTLDYFLITTRPMQG